MRADYHVVVYVAYKTTRCTPGSLIHGNRIVAIIVVSNDLGPIGLEELSRFISRSIVDRYELPKVASVFENVF
jgi:hypothetical protein